MPAKSWRRRRLRISLRARSILTRKALSSRYRGSIDWRHPKRGFRRSPAASRGRSIRKPVAGSLPAAALHPRRPTVPSRSCARSHQVTRSLVYSTDPLLGVATEMAEPLLCVKNLVKYYDAEHGFLRRELRRRIHAVDNISFDIASGET